MSTQRTRKQQQNSLYYLRHKDRLNAKRAENKRKQTDIDFYLRFPVGEKLIDIYNSIIGVDENDPENHAFYSNTIDWLNVLFFIKSVQSGTVIPPMRNPYQ